MDKFFLYLVISLISFFSQFTFAARSNNECINNIDTHATYNELILEQCNLYDADMPDVFNYLITHPDIDHFNFNNNHFTDAGLILLSKISHPLASIYLENNQITSHGALTLTKFTTLKELNLKNNKIGDEGIIAISNKLTDLIALSATDNHISDAGITALSKLSKLSFLDLENNQITDIGVMAIANNKNIFWLGLSNNQITDSGAKIIATLPRINVLSLANNRISDAGAIALGQLKFVSLDLANNKISAAGIRPLIYQHNYFYLGLDNNLLGDEGAALFVNVTDSIFRVLNLSSNQISDKGAASLAQSNLDDTLVLNHNKIKDAGAIALAQSSKLQQLYINYNHIGPIGIDALKHSRIHKVHTEGNDGIVINLKNAIYKKLLKNYTASSK